MRQVLCCCLLLAGCTVPTDVPSFAQAAPPSITEIHELNADQAGQCIRTYTWAPIDNATMYDVIVSAYQEIPDQTLPIIQRPFAHTTVRVDVPMRETTTFISVTVTTRRKGATSTPYRQTFLCP